MKKVYEDANKALEEKYGLEEIAVVEEAAALLKEHGKHIPTFDLTKPGSALPKGYYFPGDDDLYQRGK